MVIDLIACGFVGLVCCGFIWMLYNMMKK